MAWDADGTVAGYRSTVSGGAPITEYSGAQKVELNDEEDDANPPSSGSASSESDIIFVFPELREFDGLFWGQNADRATTVETSGDTTNGIDGTWAQRTADYTSFTVYDHYRDEIVSYAVNNVRGLRCHYDNIGGGSTHQRAFHIYGEISAGETPDRLLWVDNSTGSEFGLPIDYGDIPRGSAEDTEVKLRNNSGSLTAASVQLTAEDLSYGSGSWYSFKEAGGSFQSTLPLASSIGAGSDSPVITVRRVTPDAATLGLHAARAYAAVGSWS